MILFLKFRTWKEDVGSYLRWWKKLKEQASLMETWVVARGGRESGKNIGLRQLL